MSSSKATCTVTARCATPIRILGRTNTTPTSAISTRTASTDMVTLTGLWTRASSAHARASGAVALALAILGATAMVQALVFAITGSLALLADLIHNGGDALTAIPLGIAFAMRSPRAERLAGLAVVAAIFTSACVAAYESILRLIHPSTPGHLLVLALAGIVGFAGNWLAALVRTRAGRRLNSPALIADGDHARVDAYVSLAVIASAVAIAAGAPILDPVIGLGMTFVILRITRDSWRTVRGHPHHR